MKKILFIALFLMSFCGFSQEDAWVYFNDKPNEQAFFDNPLTALTQRALDRRTAQGIALNSTDAPIEQTYIDQITASTGITVKAKSKWLNCLHIRGSIADITTLTSLPFVNHIHFANNALNAKMTAPKTINPVNKQLDVQTTFNYGSSVNQIQMLNGQTLHQANYTGSGKIIAVLDSGFIGVNSIAPFTRMFTNNQYLGGYNFVAGNNDIFSTHNHGTMTLSCMTGYVDGQLVGTAPDAQYYLFITEDVASENPVEESYWVEGAEEADRLGADIISTSLGYFSYDNPSYSHSYSEMTGNVAFASQGANIAFSKGMVVVASAGNSGGTANPNIGVPAEATNVLAVGAVQSDRSYAAFSSIGPSFDNRIKPDVMAQGQNSVLSFTDGTIGTASGTSFSCPIMAGMIASFWQAIPWATNAQIIQFVKQSADRYTTPDAQYGYGIPDFGVALNNALLKNEEYAENKYKIAPNPTNDSISIMQPDGFETTKISLYNALGQLVLEEYTSEAFFTISLRFLPKGVYEYKIVNNSAIQSGKIIKN
ncbi:MAG: S8 family serine peptidase [Flavobacterium sp.]